MERRTIAALFAAAFPTGVGALLLGRWATVPYLLAWALFVWALASHVVNVHWSPWVVYYLYDARGELLYVGSTNRLRDRMLEHTNPQRWGPNDGWKDRIAGYHLVRGCRSRRHARRIERRRIRALQVAAMELRCRVLCNDEWNRPAPSWPQHLYRMVWQWAYMLESWWFPNCRWHKATPTPVEIRPDAPTEAAQAGADWDLADPTSDPWVEADLGSADVDLDDQSDGGSDGEAVTPDAVTPSRVTPGAPEGGPLESVTGAVTGDASAPTPTEDWSEAPGEPLSPASGPVHPDHPLPAPHPAGEREAHKRALAAERQRRRRARLADAKHQTA